MRPLFLIPLGLWLGVANVSFAAEPEEAIRAAGFKKVDVFARSGLFVVKNTKLSVLRTTQKGPPKAIYTNARNGELQCPVAVAETGDALFVCDGKAVVRVTPAGESKTVLTLGTLRADPLGKDLARRFDINWFLAAGPRDTLYFALLPAIGRERRSYVCRYDPTGRRTDVLECQFPTGIDVDRSRGVVYIPPLSNSNFAGATPVLLVAGFSAESHSRKRPVHHTYDWCRLSPDGKTLAMSEAATEKEPHIATLDLSSDRETVLPFPGSYVTWGAGSSIYFVRGARTLWTATLAATEPTLLYEPAGKPDSDTEGNFATPPVLSRDGSWLAWRWTIKTPQGPWRGTVLIDLTNREYRLLEQAWRDFAWAN